MATEVHELHEFFAEFANLLDTIDRCSPVLFRRKFRENLARALPEVTSRLRETAAMLEERTIRGEEFELRRGLEAAGLTENQLELKLESFSLPLRVFAEQGGEEHLEKALDFGSTILSSAAGAIPGIGSFVQELVDFIIKELRKRWRFWKR